MGALAQDFLKQIIKYFHYLNWVMTKDTSKVSVFEKLSYSSGDLASNLFWMFIVFYANYFYTDIFKLTPASLALMTIVVRFGIDLSSDVFMGIIADKTQTRYGKFRPYIIYGAIPFGIIFWLMLTTPDWEYSSKLIYAYITYSAMMLIYTIINVPYSALLGVISSNTEVRTSAASYRFAAAQLGGIIVQIATVYLLVLYGGGTVENPENQQFGYSMSALTYGIVAIGLFFLTGFFTKERVQPPKGQEDNTRSDLSNLVKNIPWWILLVTSLFFIACISFRNGSIIYYFKYYSAEKATVFDLFGKEMYFDLASLYMAMGTAVALLSTAFASQLAKLFGGKKKAFLIFMSLTAVSSIFYYYIPPEATGLMFIGQFILSATTGPTGALMFAMYADTADYSEYKTGRRATGLIFSAVSAAQKGGFAIAAIITNVVLSYFGYEPDKPSGDSINAINLSMSYFPAVASAIAAILVFFYPLTDKKMLEIEKELTSRKEKENDAEAAMA